MAENQLNDADFELLLQFVDGELTGTAQARAQNLVASHSDARAFVDDWAHAKLALRKAVLEVPIAVDLSRIRGRVMTKLPSEARQGIQTSQEGNGFLAFVQKLGFGKVSFAVGAAVAAAIWLLATSTGAADPTHAAFTVRVIEASQDPTPFQDPALAPVNNELQNFKHNYNRFKVLRTEVMKLKVNDRGVIKLPDGKEFAVQLLGFVPGSVDRVRHKVEMPGTQSTRLMAYGGRTLDVLPTGPKATIVWTTLEKH